MNWIYVGIKAAFAGLFGSLWSRLFPVRTAADQRAVDLDKSLTIADAEAGAAAQAPTDKNSLIESLKDGRIALLLYMSLVLSSCAQTVATACPVPRQWTDKQQDEIAANLSTMPPDSPLIAVGIEWARLRAESNACLKNGE